MGGLLTLLTPGGPYDHVAPPAVYFGARVIAACLPRRLRRPERLGCLHEVTNEALKIYARGSEGLGDSGTTCTSMAPFFFEGRLRLITFGTAKLGNTPSLCQRCHRLAWLFESDLFPCGRKGERGSFHEAMTGLQVLYVAESTEKRRGTASEASTRPLANLKRVTFVFGSLTCFRKPALFSVISRNQNERDNRVILALAPKKRTLCRFWFWSCDRQILRTRCMCGAYGITIVLVNYFGLPRGLSGISQAGICRSLGKDLRSRDCNIPSRGQAFGDKHCVSVGVFAIRGPD